MLAAVSVAALASSLPLRWWYQEKQYNARGSVHFIEWGPFFVHGGWFAYWPAVLISIIGLVIAMRQSSPYKRWGAPLLLFGGIPLVYLLVSGMYETLVNQPVLQETIRGDRHLIDRSRNLFLQPGYFVALGGYLLACLAVLLRNKAAEENA